MRLCCNKKGNNSSIWLQKQRIQVLNKSHVILHKNLYCYNNNKKYWLTMKGSFSLKRSFHTQWYCCYIKSLELHWKKLCVDSYENRIDKTRQPPQFNIPNKHIIQGVYCQQYPKYSLTYINKKQYTINNIQTIKIMNT